MAREFQIVEVTEITAKDGKKFTAYKTVTKKGGKKMDCRFRRTITNLPTEPCVIVVPDNAANVDTSRQYPILWISEIAEIKPLVRNDHLEEFF